MVFTPSTFFIVVHTNYGIDLEVQITPIMQLYIKACDSNKGTLRGVIVVACVCVLSFNVINIAAGVKLLLHPGLCGDFNDVEADDFKTMSGLIEGTAFTFASTWKIGSTCVDVKTTEDPCAISMSKSWSRLLPSKLTSYLFFSHGLSCVSSVCFCRELRQSLVHLAVRPQRLFCQVSL